MLGEKIFQLDLKISFKNGPRKLQVSESLFCGVNFFRTPILILASKLFVFHKTK